MQMDAVLAEMNSIKNRFLVRKGQFESLLATRDTLIRNRDEKRSDLAVMEEAKLLLADSSRYAREQVKAQLEQLVTSGLQFIFGDDMRFEIEIVERSNRTEAEFWIVTMQDGEQRRTRPEASNGGGVVDIISLIIRIAILQAMQLEGPLILDEPLKMLSGEYIVRVGEFLQQLADHFGRQIIMATHDSYLSEVADCKYLVTQNDGISHVTVV